MSQVDGVVKGDWEAIAPLVLMTIAIVTIVELVRADDQSPCAPVCDCALKGMLWMCAAFAVLRPCRQAGIGSRAGRGRLMRTALGVRNGYCVYSRVL